MIFSYGEIDCHSGRYKIMFKINNFILFLCLFFELSCFNNAPLRTTPQENPIIIYKIAISRPNNQVTSMRNWTDWTPQQRLWLQDLPHIFRSVAILRIVPSESEADFVIRPFDAPNCQTHGAGMWILNDSRSVYINSACFANQNMFLIGVAHEIGHALDYKLNRLIDPMAGQWHICRNLEENRSDCYPRFYGRAILNPTLPTQEEISEQYYSTELDVRFLHRIE